MAVSLRRQSQTYSDSTKTTTMAVTYNHLQRNLILHPPPVPPHAASKRISPSSPNPFFAKISGKFKNGIFKIFGNNTISEFTKIASSFLQLGSKEEHDLDGVLGVTEDVVAFARSVALHPEVWLDFPLLNDEDSDAVEHLTPSLAALRIELCPGYMSDGNFWKIYFVLMHPRLSKTDAAILSTPQVS
ncbi:hypothetical protein glysoja_038076 [Glycine soja]|uniref:BSD domain-containing protein n=1 Tax=Glycine soja TaxID=3848 RepID=A0A0B2PY04_GLYSO|nr:hypothetical protein glysoja_038076 [Glycine soja]